MIILNVPFAEKEKAKALGARWNNARKVWYVADGQDITPFKRWHTTQQNSNVKAASDSSLKPATSRLDAHAGIKTVGEHYIELPHDCDPFIECLECKPLLDAAGWFAAANILK